MFHINEAGNVSRKEVRAGSHEAHILAGVPLPGDFQNLSEQARISALLMPDILASSIAPATARSYAAQWSKFESWCRNNNRVCLPASSDTCKLYLANVGLRCRTLPPVLAAQAGIRYYLGIQFPDIDPPTDSLAVSTVITGLKLKFAH